MSKTYAYEPEIYSRIVTGPARGSEEPAAYLSVVHGSGERNAKIWADDVPAVSAGIAQGLHLAAGLLPPVILEHPASLPDAITEGGVTVGMEGRAILIGVAVAPPSKRLEPEEARTLAAALAVYADRSEAQPDPEEIEELAALIRHDIHPDSGGPSETDRIAARAALRWMKGKRQREGGAS